jgi:hypothetical protein
MSIQSEYEEYEYSDTDDIYEQHFKAEKDIFERVGMPGISELIGDIQIGTGTNFQRHIDKLIRTPIQKFAVYVNATCRSMMSLDSNILNEEDIINIIKRAQVTEKIEYKNPTGFILGYVCTKGGIKIDEKIINIVSKHILPYLEDKSITLPDIIRYSRLWLFHE